MFAGIGLQNTWGKKTFDRKPNYFPQQSLQFIFKMVFFSSFQKAEEQKQGKEEKKKKKTAE